MPAYISDKGNLMLAKNSLALAKQGYDLMDKKKYTDQRTDGSIDEAGRSKRSTRRSLMRMNVCKGEHRKRNQQC